MANKINLNRKKIYNGLDMGWRIIGVIILIFFVYVLSISKNPEFQDMNNTLIVVSFFSIVFYGLISAIVFAPKILVRFSKRFKKKRRN